MTRPSELSRTTSALNPAAPTASVVICCWTADRTDLLRRSVLEAAGQAHDGDEVLVVVDHNDALARAMSTWAATEVPPERARRIRVIESTGARGLSGARNTGVEHSGGDLIVFLDDDAVPRPGWLDGLRSTFADPSVAGAGGGIAAVWTRGRPGWFPEELDWVVGCDYRGLPGDGAEIRNPIGANMALRRSALRGLRFDTGLGRDGSRPAGAEETELAIRMRQADPSVRFVRRATACVDHHVTAERHRLGYLLRRCWHEGLSKGSMTSRVGAGDGLSAERGYLLSVPGACVRHIGAVRHRDLWGPGRAATLMAGTIATGVGYLRGRAVR